MAKSKKKLQLKNNKGKIITEEADILKRWKEFLRNIKILENTSSGYRKITMQEQAN